MFFGADADAGSSESPVGVSEGGGGRFLSFTLATGFSGVGSEVLAWISGCGGRAGESIVRPVPSMFVSTVVVVEAAPVGGSLAFLVLFFFFLVVAACPAAVVNRVLGHKREQMYSVMKYTYQVVVAIAWSLPSLRGEMVVLTLGHRSSRRPHPD